MIGEDKFSFYFTDPGLLSWVDLGEPDLTNIRPDATLKTVPMIEEDFFWADYCQGFAIGSTDAENTYAWASLEDYPTEIDNSIYSILETGSFGIMISALYFESFIVKILDTVPEVGWLFEDGLLWVECDADFPSIWFMFSQKWIEVNPKDYVIPVGDGVCIFFIMPVDLAINMLGMPLFVDYYTVHDPVQGTISWAPHTSSLKESLVHGPIPSKDQLIGVGEA